MDDVEITEYEDGVAIRVKAHPGARREGVAGVHDHALRVNVNAAPEKGKANKAIAKVLSKILGVKAGNINIISGETSQHKRVSVAGLSVDTVKNLLGEEMERAK